MQGWKEIEMPQWRWLLFSKRIKVVLVQGNRGTQSLKSTLECREPTAWSNGRPLSRLVLTSLGLDEQG